MSAIHRCRPASRSQTSSSASGGKTSSWAITSGWTSRRRFGTLRRQRLRSQKRLGGEGLEESGLEPNGSLDLVKGQSVLIGQVRNGLSPPESLKDVLGSDARTGDDGRSEAPTGIHDDQAPVGPLAAGPPPGNEEIGCPLHLSQVPHDNFGEHLLTLTGNVHEVDLLGLAILILPEESDPIREDPLGR